MSQGNTDICPHCQAVREDQSQFCGQCGCLLLATQKSTSMHHNGVSISSLMASLPTRFLPPTPGRSRSQRFSIYVIIAGILVGVLVSAGTFVTFQLLHIRLEISARAPASQSPASVPQSPTLSARAPTLQPSQVLYNENGTDNWQGWNKSRDWKTSNEELLNDGSVPATTVVGPTVVAPYTVSVNDYAVEAEIELQRWQSNLPNWPGNFGITVRGSGISGSDSTWSGYMFQLMDAFPLDNNRPSAALCNNKRLFKDAIIGESVPFDPGSNVPHVYRVEVRGTEITVKIDEKIVLDRQDNLFLTGGQVGLETSNAQISVMRFSVIAL